LKPFEFAVAAILGILAIPIVLWSYNHWQTVTGSGTYSNTTSITGSPSISASEVDKVLCSNGSPACGTGYTLYTYGSQYSIDPSFALAVFRHESSFGKAGVARENLSLGNLRCIQGYACVNGFAAFPSWQAGYSAFYQLIAGPLYVKAGLVTPEAILAKYAPVADNNDPAGYAADVEASMHNWRSS